MALDAGRREGEGTLPDPGWGASGTPPQAKLAGANSGRPRPVSGLTSAAQGVREPWMWDPVPHRCRRGHLLTLWG